METLTMNQMEQIEGGLECQSGLGLAAGLAAGGLLIAATGGTAAAVVAGAALWEGGVAAAVTAKCFKR